MRCLFLICLAFLACSKPLVKQTEQNYAESRKEAFAAVSVENTATETVERKKAFAIEREIFSFDENIEADSLVRFNHDGSVKEKFYGVKGSKKGNGEKDKLTGGEEDKAEKINKENLQKQEAGEEIEIEAKAKTNEKNEESFFANIGTALNKFLVFIFICAVAYVLWRLK